MKTVWKPLVMVASVALLLSVGVMSAAAQTITTATNDSPASAVYIDNQSHTVDVDKSLWFKFDYNASLHAKDRTPIYLTLVNGNNSGVEMMIYTPDQAVDMIPDGIENWRQETPIGQGTALHEMCDSHIPKPTGDCVSPNLTWVGTFAESGTYFVRVRNTNPSASNFTLIVQGADVGIGNNPGIPAPGR